jgi:CBS domain-containing protein
VAGANKVMLVGTAVEVLDAWVDLVETLARRLASARDVATLAQLVPEMHAVARAMLAEDVGAGTVSRTLSALNDALAVRAISLVAARHRLPSAAWCWLAFGSEGRCEQTFVTDQDNGIVFSAADAAEARALRPLFLGFAGEVNQALADCGFPLCDGGIMAGKPECCLSLLEWRERFSGWVRTPEPAALLNATIFFDLRALYGDALLANDLRAQIARITADASAFLRMLADNALAAAPPLGVLRDFTARDGVIELKKFGTRLFVDAARILGMTATLPGTVARLRHAVARGNLVAQDAEAATAAFQHLQRLRLLGQQRALSMGEVPGNQVVTHQLNAFERRVLYEALKQARLLQQHLKNSYHIEGALAS